jgi:hypothetical protein
LKKKEVTTKLKRRGELTVRRKTNKEVRKEHRITLILGCCFIAFAVFCILLPLIPRTPYSEHFEKEVIVSESDFYFGGVRGASYYYIITTDGEIYNITGEYSASKLREYLKEGTQITIKYTENKLFNRKYAEEIVLNGELLVKYDNDKPIDWTGSIIFATFSDLVGIGFILSYRFHINHNRKLQAKRDARIKKKYGGNILDEKSTQN